MEMSFQSARNDEVTIEQAHPCKSLDKKLEWLFSCHIEAEGFLAMDVFSNRPLWVQEWLLQESYLMKSECTWYSVIFFQMLCLSILWCFENLSLEDWQ